MDSIYITPVNEAYMKVDGSDSIREELGEYFTFFAPNYQFSPKFKNRIWDGKIRNYNKKTRLIYRGLRRKVYEFADINGYKVIDQLKDYDTEFSYKEAADFVQSLKLPKSLEIRDYQIKSFVKAIRKKRLTILSPTASGKSFIAYLIIRYLLSTGKKKGLLVVPTTALVEQMYSDFEDYGWNSQEHCHKVYSGKPKLAPQQVMITTWQTLQNMPDDFFDRFDFVIGDEAHLFKARELIRIMTNLVNAQWRIAMTGSMDEQDSSESTIVGLFGPTSQQVTTSELQQRGNLSDLTIKCLILKYSEDVCNSMSHAKYPEEYEYIVSNNKRVNYVRNLALSLEGNTLVLFRLKELQGKVLYQAIKDKAPENKNVYYIDGNTSTEDRERIRKRLETEIGSIVVASFGVYSTGTNVRNLHNAIFASFTKSRITNLQSIGRLLRKHPSKEDAGATLFDIVDDLSTEDWTNYAVKHYMKRRELYAQQNFTVRTYEIKLGE